MIVATAAASAQTQYRIVDHWKVGGTGGWDYVVADSAAHLLYVTHGPRVEVLDTTTGKSVAAITGLKGTHGVALDSEGKLGYISDGASNEVVIFDRKSFAKVGSVATGTNPDGILYEPSTKTVWAFNGRSNNATVIDAASGKAMSTIALPGKPEFPQADGKGHVFVNIEDKNSIVHLDASKKTISSVWPLENCESPSGLALDNEHHRLFAVCDGKKMAVVDAVSGKQLASPAIGDGPDAAGYSALHQLAFSSNGDGTLSVIDAANGYKPLQTVGTQKGARTMAYDDAVDRVYLVTAEFGPRPAPTPQSPRPRPAVLADTFTVIVVGRK
ncbi:YncE family protein [Edaphobacter bradus]|uniref:YncE family protein n=1 Tax=Edaphobacter bradus TaxID=2259016 RepID=UPI00295B7E8F|nr:YncE family protein [Edaphobacter bradus]